MIRLENIGVKFGSFEALKNINIHVKEGEFFTFLGLRKNNNAPYDYRFYPAKQRNGQRSRN